MLTFINFDNYYEPSWSAYNNTLIGLKHNNKAVLFFSTIYNLLFKRITQLTALHQSG